MCNQTEKGTRAVLPSRRARSRSYGESPQGQEMAARNGGRPSCRTSTACSSSCSTTSGRATPASTPPSRYRLLAPRPVPSLGFRLRLGLLRDQVSRFVFAFALALALRRVVCRGTGHDVGHESLRTDSDARHSRPHTQKHTKRLAACARLSPGYNVKKDRSLHSKSR
jgi:hypothetical protein